MGRLYVVIEPIPKTGARGDRDTRPPHPYNDYRIHVLHGEEQMSRATVVHEIDGYDHWWTTIRPEKDVRTEAWAFARRLAKRLNGVAAMLKNRARYARKKQEEDDGEA